MDSILHDLEGYDIETFFFEFFRDKVLSHMLELRTGKSGIAPTSKYGRKTFLEVSHHR